MKKFGLESLGWDFDHQEQNQAHKSIGLHSPEKSVIIFIVIMPSFPTNILSNESTAEQFESFLSSIKGIVVILHEGSWEKYFSDDLVSCSALEAIEIDHYGKGQFFRQQGIYRQLGS